jgi:hypothetical protein
VSTGPAGQTNGCCTALCMHDESDHRVGDQITGRTGFPLNCDDSILLPGNDFDLWMKGKNGIRNGCEASSGQATYSG